MLNINLTNKIQAVVFIIASKEKVFNILMANFYMVSPVLSGTCAATTKAVSTDIIDLPQRHLKTSVRCTDCNVDLMSSLI